jgi:hypothetical protein
MSTSAVAVVATPLKPTKAVIGRNLKNRTIMLDAKKKKGRGRRNGRVSFQDCCEKASRNRLGGLLGFV